MVQPQQQQHSHMQVGEKALITDLKPRAWSGRLSNNSPLLKEGPQVEQRQFAGELASS